MSDGTYDPEGVSVLVTGSDGITSPANCLFIQTGCADAYFYLAPEGPTGTFPVDQSFDTDVSASLGDSTNCIGPTDANTSSDSDDSDSDDCDDDQSTVQTGGSVDVSLKGSVDLSIEGTNPDGSMLDVSWDGGIPSAVVVGGEVTVTSASLSVGFGAEVSGTLDVPIPVSWIPDFASLDDEISVQGDASVQASLSLAADDTFSLLWRSGGVVTVLVAELLCRRSRDPTERDGRRDLHAPRPTARGCRQWTRRRRRGAVCRYRMVRWRIHNQRDVVDPIQFIGRLLWAHL
jgi:hypothetical protein